MKTVTINVAVIIWVSLLLFAPALVWASYRRPSPLTFAIGGGASLTLISFVTYVAGLNGIGSIVPLRVCAVALGVGLAWSVVRFGLQLIRQWKQGIRSFRPHPDWVPVPLGLFLGTWVMLPPLRGLSHQGVTFGLATLGNPDIAAYALAAENTGISGFRDSFHLANRDLGAWSRDESYIGATSLINFVSAATGLSNFQATLATMGVAVCLLGVGLWALSRTIWPEAPFAAGAAVIVACLAGFTAYTIAQFFLAAVLGLTSVVTALAGATAVVRQSRIEAVLAIAVGGACGIYSYGHLCLPFSMLLPFWVIFASVLGGVRHWRRLLSAVALTVVGLLGALVLASVALAEAITLMRIQSNAPSGFPIPAVSGFSAFIWPSSIGDPSNHIVVIGSWVVALAAVVIGLVAAWQRGLRHPVLLAATLTIACLALLAAFNRIYGTDRYQFWKMESFLLPLLVVAAFPAFGATVRNTARIGRPIMGVAIGAVFLSPVLVWAPALNPLNPGKITTGSLVSLGKSPALANVASINMRVGSPLQNMGGGAIIANSTVIFTENSYYSTSVSLQTCTLTTVDRLSPGETDFVSLGDNYVLLNKPSTCARKK